MLRSCLERFLGNCPHCERDYNPNHHPNNLDCPRYKEIKIEYLFIKEDRRKPEGWYEQ